MEDVEGLVGSQRRGVDPGKRKHRANCSWLPGLSGPSCILGEDLRRSDVANRDYRGAREAGVRRILSTLRFEYGRCLSRDPGHSEQEGIQEIDERCGQVIRTESSN